MFGDSKMFVSSSTFADSSTFFGLSMLASSPRLELASSLVTFFIVDDAQLLSRQPDRLSGCDETPGRMRGI